MERNLTISTRSDAKPLVEAARSGDGAAFAQLVEPCIPSALALATLIAGSQSDGADAVQDALLAAWRSLGSLKEAAAFPSWFRTLAVRSAMKAGRHRQQIRFKELELDDAADYAQPDLVDRGFEFRILDRAFDRLEAKDRLILALRHANNLSTEAIAATLSIPEGTVKSRVHSAMQRLRAAYEAEERR